MDMKMVFLDLVECIVWEKGYDGFSYVDLVKDVGICKVSIYYYFLIKFDLVLELVKCY